MRVAAVQLDSVLGDVPRNLEMSRQIAQDAARKGADWIVLPEFFTTAMGFAPRIADAALTPDGAATQMMCDVARRHGVTVGGSFICRDEDGENRNAFLLVGPDGLIGRHDKDIPTMWENCFYVGGSDDGVLRAGDLDLGVALCLEFDRSQTARRLQERVDLVIGGSFCWGVPRMMSGPLHTRMNADVDELSDWAIRFARILGVPTVDATHCCELACRMPWMPFTYRERARGGAKICDAYGQVLARRDRDQGAGFAIADVEPGRVPASEPIPDSFWIRPLGAIGSFAWRYQRMHGRRWYRKHARARPVLELHGPASSETPAAVR